MIQVIGFMLATYGFSMLFMGSPGIAFIGMISYLIGCYEMFIKPIETIEWDEE